MATDAIDFEMLKKDIFLNFILGYQVTKITTIHVNFVFDTCTIRIFVWITQKLL